MGGLRYMPCAWTITSVTRSVMLHDTGSRPLWTAASG